MSEAEQRTQSAIKVRQVTDYQASWTEEERGDSGSFTVQLILDDGAEEYVLQPNVKDMKVIQDLLNTAGSVFFDLERKVLIPNDLPTGG
jgi:hypothetical protein